MSGMARPAALHRVLSTNKLDQVTEGNALVKALTPSAEVPEKGGHGLLLVFKPGIHELERVCVWCYKLSNLLLRQVRTVSALEQWHM